MIVLVSGSRKWTDRRTIFNQLAASFPMDTQFIVGDAGQGVDEILMALFDHERLGWLTGYYQTKKPPRVYRADWDRYRRGALENRSRATGRNPAGMIRNDEMLDVPPDHVVCFWDGKSHGTKHVIDGAIKRAIPLDVYVRPVAAG